MDLRDTVAVVTGGGTGIGRATALAPARSGCRAVVATCSRSTADAEATVSELTAAGCEAAAERVDVADDGQVRAPAARVRSRFGTVDVLVDHAGTTRAVPHPDLDALTGDVFHHVLDVNVASISGYRAGGSSIAYGVNEAGLLQLTHSLAVALAPDVRVNAVAPGTVATRRQTSLHGRTGFAERAEAEGRTVPLRRTADPDHVAQAVLGVLAMDLVTGEAVIVDGGKHVVY